MNFTGCIVSDVERIRKVIPIVNEVSPTFCLAKWYHANIYLQTGQTHSCYHPPPHQVPLADLVHLPLDLADLDSVRRGAEIAALEPRIDGLINSLTERSRTDALEGTKLELDRACNRVGRAGTELALIVGRGHVGATQIHTRRQRLGRGDVAMVAVIGKVRVEPSPTANCMAVTVLK